MTSAEPAKENSKYLALLCGLLVDVGTRVLRDVFDRIHPPEKLHSNLSSQPIHETLLLLRKGWRPTLNATQWEKLYPRPPGAVSSANFDITLLTVLLKSTCGLNFHSGGGVGFPPTEDKTTEADISRLKYFRNRVCSHSSKGSLSEETFNTYWLDVSGVLLRLGGTKYRSIIENLKHETMDPAIGEHYKELLRQWMEDEDTTNEKLKKISERTFFATVTAGIKRSLQWLHTSVSTNEEQTATVFVAPLTGKRAGNSNCTEERVNRLGPELCLSEPKNKLADKVIILLDDAINLHQSECIEASRNNLRDISGFLQKVDASHFRIPTKFGWYVVLRGKDLFFDGNVSCSVKHGTIILDSGNAGAQFFVKLLNILGAFALETSEFKIAKEMFSALIDFHGVSDATTTRLSNLGSAFNNRGCVSIIMGEFDQGDSDFKNSLRHFNCELHKQLPDPSVDAMIVAVESNRARLDLMSRHFARGLEEQKKLAEFCKNKISELPLQTIFMIIYNQAVLHTTLENLAKAEKELKWLISFCKEKRREECDILLNFVSLQLCEVLLLRGKPKAANKAFPFEELTSASVQELMPSFGGIHFNVRIEAFEKLVDVFVRCGKVKVASELLTKGLKIVGDAFGPDHFNVSSLLHKQSSILRLMGDFSESFDKLRCSANMLRETFGEKHPLLVKCYMSLGDVAFQLNRRDDSHVYFQRAMENVELLYQVSLSDQLSMKFVSITSNSKYIPCGISFEWNRYLVQEYRIEGLVAEYGQALAVLSLRLEVDPDWRGFGEKGKKPLRGKGVLVPSLESVSMISQKHVRDLLRTGQTLLVQGMKKEAASFLQLASKYCEVHHAKEAILSSSLVGVYTAFSRASLRNEHRRKINPVSLRRFVEEVAASIHTGCRGERNSEVTEVFTSDCEVNLKMVLILVISLSVQLKMHDTAFAAYHLYASLSQDDESFSLSLGNGIQIYSSRASIACNGEIAVQHFLFSSAIGLTENVMDCHRPDSPLFRSLALKGNVPTNGLLVAFNSPFFLDIDEIRQLEQKALLSFQEYLEIDTFENGRTATQIIVDLTPTSCFEPNTLLTGSCIELLPLCLFEESDKEVPHNKDGSIVQLFPGMCEEITCMTFADEWASCFMFRKVGLWLLQQADPEKISTLRVQNQCLDLTIVSPVKARIRLWRECNSVKQKIQLVSSTKDDSLSLHNSVESVVNQSSCRTVFNGFSPAAILHRAQTRGVTCETKSLVPQCSHSPDTVTSETSGIVPKGPQSGKQSSEVFTEEIEEIQSMRTDFVVTTLGCLREVSELSRMFCGDVAHDEPDCDEEQSRAYNAHCSKRQEQAITANPPGQDAKFIQPKQTSISSDSRLAASGHEEDTETQNVSSTRSLAPVNVEGSCGSDADATTEMIKDGWLLGRKLFEEDRKLRSSLKAKIQEDLKKKEMFRRLNRLEDFDNPSSETFEKNFAFVERPSHDGANHCEPFEFDSAQRDPEQSFDFDRSHKRIFSSGERELTITDQNVQAFEKSKLQDVLNVSGGPRKEDDRLRLHVSVERAATPTNHSAQEATDEFQNDTLKTSMVTSLYPAEEENATNKSSMRIGTEFTELDQKYHQKREHQQGDSGSSINQKVKRVGESEVGAAKASEGFSTEERNENSGESSTFANGNGVDKKCRSNVSGRGADAELWTSQTDENDSNYDVKTQNTSERNQGTSQLNTGDDANRVQSYSRASIPRGDANRNIYAFSKTNQDVVDSPIPLPKTKGVGLLGGAARKSITSKGGFGRFGECLIPDQSPVPFGNLCVVGGPNKSSKPSKSKDFGGARPKTIRNFHGVSGTFEDSVQTHRYEKNAIGLDPDFLARHDVTNNPLTLARGYLDGCGIPRRDRWLEDTDDPFFPANYFSNRDNGGSPSTCGEGLFQSKHNSSHFLANEGFQGESTIQSGCQSVAIEENSTVKQYESWHFPPQPSTTENYAVFDCFQPRRSYNDQPSVTHQNSTQVQDPVFHSSGPQSVRSDMLSLTSEFKSSNRTYETNAIESARNSQLHSVGASEIPHDSSEDSLYSNLKDEMEKHVRLWASINTVVKQKPVEKLGVQEQSNANGEHELIERVRDSNSKEEASSLRQREEAVDTVRNVQQTPVQETPRPVCAHYQRRCLVRFPCCGEYYPCHRCHNDSSQCSDDQARAINATHIRCTICYHEQQIDEGSQTCRGCNSKMSAYFCVICKHFTSVDKNPFHCEKCGICRIHKDKSFHCDVCNVCLDKRLEGKHKCRPDSGHDECCICLEDAFSGCQILPCSHKVHKDCAIAMIQNGVRKCPICRHPLFPQPNNNTTQ